MKEYIYAISIVGIKGNAVNNQLSNGIGYLPTILKWIKSTNYDIDFINNISLINCNIQEMNNSENRYEFNRKYINGNLNECLDSLVAEIIEGLK